LCSLFLHRPIIAEPILLAWVRNLGLGGQLSHTLRSGILEKAAELIMSREDLNSLIDMPLHVIFFTQAATCSRWAAPITLRVASYSFSVQAMMIFSTPTRIPGTHHKLTQAGSSAATIAGLVISRVQLDSAATITLLHQQLLLLLLLLLHCPPSCCSSLLLAIVSLTASLFAVQEQGTTAPAAAAAAAAVVSRRKN
jgi:hypothetical protein